MRRSQRKILVVFIFYISLFSVPCGTLAAIVGDVNLDGQIDLTEAMYALQVAAGHYPSVDFSCQLEGRGNWAFGTDYSICDVVKDTASGSYYICTIAHIATDTFANDSANWSQLSLQAAWTKSGDNISYTNGKVGIGTSNPVDKLEVEGGSLTIDGNEGMAALRFRQTDTMVWTIFTAPWLEGGDLRIRNEGATSDVMTFDKDTGNIGVGTSSPSEKLEVDGNLKVTGSIEGNIHFSQITGLLGSNYTLPFPDIINNMAILEISGVVGPTEAVIIGGPGYDIERIPGYDGYGQPLDDPGLTQENPFIFEIGGADADAIQAYFTEYATSQVTRSISLIINNNGGSESFRWNIFEFAPSISESGTDGRTRFTFIPTSLPDRILHYQSAPGIVPYGNSTSNNLATDTRVEISGVTADVFYPQVEDDAVSHTLTLTYDFVEGAGIHAWVKEIITLGVGKQSLSVIQESTPGVETSRRNYYECFPVSFKQVSGFGMDIKLKTKLILAYNLAEDAN